MLALLLGLLFSSGIHAQNFSYTSNAEYGVFVMEQFKVANGDHFSSNDPTINLTMDCLAANGYGQWTCSSATGSFDSIAGNSWLFSPNQSGINGGGGWNPNSSSGWFLLGNRIGKTSESYDPTNSTTIAAHPGCQPPGVVSGGTFNTTFPTSPKVVANLNGRVRYVWIEPSGRITFKVEGLNDVLGVTPPERQIDISLGNLPNPPINRQIIKKVIFDYPTGGGDVSTIDAGGVTSHGVTNETGMGGSGFHADEFDIAMDKNFLYIVWESAGAIWAKVVNLSDGTTATTAFQVSATGIRPTVACDVRNSSSTPFFAIAFMNGGNVMVGEFSGNTIQHGGLKALLRSYNDPVTSGLIDNYVCNATHARVVVSSVAGTSHVTGVYVRECDELIFFNTLSWAINGDGIHWNDFAWYVDGIRVYHGIGTDPLPSPIPQSAGGHYNSAAGIVDKPITAFANPYDNQTGTYNQFHCLYQLQITNNGTIVENPLILIRGADNGFGNNPSSNTNNTRLLLNQETIGVAKVVDDPTSYCGAVNQMGIHVHWLANDSHNGSAVTHYYARDTRAFDEDVEENTLVTNRCIIADGSGHGGTSDGAKLLDGVTMTIWSDPNYGAVNGASIPALSGMYQQFLGVTSEDNIGTIDFWSTGLSLTVGTSDGNNEAMLATMPLCRIAWGASSAGTITINPGSTWDYFAAEISDWEHLSVNLQGFTTGTLPAILNMHGGSTFAAMPSFTSDFGKVNILFEANVDPINNTANSSKSAIWDILTNTFLTDSKVNSFIPSSTSTIVILVEGIPSSFDLSVPCLASTRTDYSNLITIGGDETGGGIGIVNCQGNIYGTNGNPTSITFDGGVATRFRLKSYGPQLAGFTVENIDFDKYPDRAIWIERPSEMFNDDGTYAYGADYDNILVSSNTFATMKNDGSANTGIYIKNFNQSSPTNLFAKLNVEGNIFDVDNSSTQDGNSAIEFVRSTGNITHNHIIDASYNIGIFLTSFVGAGPTVTKSYLCNNFIANIATHGDGSGIQSDHYQGFVKLCQINSCLYGYESNGDDNPKIVFSSIKNCLGVGIDVFDASEVDLSGVHGATTGSDDLAAFDTVSGNLQCLLYCGDAQINLNSTFDFVDLGNSNQLFPWSNFAENNIFRDGSTHHHLLWRDFGSATTDGSTGNIDNNWWGLNSHTPQHQINPNTDPVNWDPDNATDAICGSGVTYHTTAILSPAANGCGSPESPCWSCSGGFEKVGHGKPQPLAKYLELDSCKIWHNVAVYTPQNQTEAKWVYDSAQHYIESCAARDDNSWQAFLHMDGDVSILPDTHRYLNYRSWLISVLYLNNTNPAYFCACMNSIAQTYSNAPTVPNGDIAIINYLRGIQGCAGFGFDHIYQEMINGRHQNWLDNLANGDTTIEDTVLPSMTQLGLDSLLRLHDLVPTPSTLIPAYITSFTSNPNPFVKETTLQFTLNRMTYTTVSIYDELGRLVWGDGRGSSLEAGVHTIHIDASSFPSGTLYARISTGFGEVKTVKLVHEK